MSKITLRKMISASIFACIITICSWISFPFPLTGIPITLQTMAIFLSLLVIGGKWSSASILIYIILGIIGIPVFSGFKSGIGVILGPTGGYVLGFLIISLLYWLMEVLFKKEKIWIKTITLLLGLILCYAFGTVWFVFVYTKSSGSMTFITALGYCVFPYIIPDLLKLGIAISLSLLVNKKIKNIGIKNKEENEKQQA